ncbi:MAG TPA: hypothetical protein VN620_01875, partial [Candidatus Methylomirabilis sp.]|nr:hypothetical protein [Candidatus Methylomirabilis sp.]
RYLLYALNDVDYRGFVNGTTRLKLTQSAMRQISLKVQVSRFAAGWLAASLRVFALDAGVSLACVLRVPSPY